MTTAAGAVAISGIAVGDEVLAYHEATGEIGSYAVTATHEHDDPVLIHLTVDADLLDEQPGEVIVTTPEHPFWVLGTWVDAGEVTVGMPLSRATDDGRLAASGTVTGVERVEQVRTMYDLTVAEAHTFFVGEGAWLVHNTGCPTGLRNASPGLRGLFGLNQTDSVRNLPIVTIRTHLLENGFEMNLAKNGRGYLFRNLQTGEEVRIMNRHGGWDIRIRNQDGNYLDEFGNVGRTRADSHRLEVESK